MKASSCAGSVRPVSGWRWALLCAAFADGRSYRLNEPFPLVPSFDVTAFDASADGAWIVYLAADIPADGPANLYSVPGDGSAAPRALTANADADLVFADVRLSPDGTRVLYVTLGSFPSERTLHCVPVDGSAPPLDLSPNVDTYQVTADSSRVVFRGDILTADRFLLCSQPLDGSAGALVLNAPLPPGSDVNEFALVPGGTRVVYRANGLFSAPIAAAGAALTLDGSALPGFRVDAGGQRVVYRAEKTAGVAELFSVPVDASATSVRLNTPLSGSKDVEDFLLSLDGTHVYYRADEATNDVVELYAVPADASAAPLRLSPAPVAGGDVQAGLALAANGARLVFRGDLLADGVVELFSVPADGGAPATRLNGALAPGTGVLEELALAPNGTRVAFLAGTASAATLFSVPLDGSAAPLALDSDAQFRFRELALAGSRVSYEKPDATGSHLWSAPLDGSAAALALSGGEDLREHRTILGGAGVLYTADEDIRGVFELFARPLNGVASSLQISHEFAPDFVSGSVLEFLTAGEDVLFVADPDESDVRALYSVPLSRRHAPRCLSATGGAPLNVFPFLFEPLKVGAGGTRVVFLASTATARELYSAPVDGSSPPVRLSAPLPPGGNVFAFGLSGDGLRVVYYADQEVDEVLELYRVEIDGSTSPLKVSGTMGPGGDVQSGYENGFVADFDGSHVVFVADRDTDDVLELYVGDGLAPPVKLSGPLPSFGDVALDPQLSADGAWVFYRADDSLDQLEELFRAPSDGSSPAVRLSGANLRSSGVQEGFRVTPDASRVLFRAWELGSSRNVFTVPADGSAAPLQLNSASPNWYSTVSELALDPTGTRAVFRYDPDSARLYSVPVDGSAPDVLLTPLVGNQHVLEDRWAISPDGTRVVYEVYTVSCCNDLWSVPIGGGAHVRLVSHGAVASPTEFVIDPTSRRVAFVEAPAGVVFAAPSDSANLPLQLSASTGFGGGGCQFSPDGGAVLFRIQTRQAGSFDLYAALLERAPRAAGPPTVR